MAQTVLTADIIAKEALMLLDNNLVMAKQVFRGYEDDFSNKVNGYSIGETLSIRKPTEFTVRDGPTMAVQDVIEGKTTITVDKMVGVDFRFSSKDLTLRIGELSDRVIKPAMIKLANRVDTDLMALYASVPHWVGTPGQTINSYTDFAKIPERMDEFAVPQDGRTAVLSPADNWGLIGSQTALYMSDVAKQAYRQGDLGNLAGVDTFMSQNVPTLTTGTRTGSILVNGTITSATTDYSTVKDTMTQSIGMDAFGTATDTIAAGEVFTIDGVWAVNPVTKATLPFLKQFVVTAAVAASGSAVTVVAYPALIWSGAFQNVAVVGVTNLNNQPVTFMGSASTNYRQNLAFNKNAFALVSVPLVSPPGAYQVSRQSYKGTNVRVIPVYDGTNDTSAWRLDLLYGVKAIDPRLAARASGTA
jgi:hypothetical protein